MDIYAATKGFLLLFEFDVLSHDSKETFTDGTVTVEAVEVHSSSEKPSPPLNQSPWYVDYLEGLDGPEKSEGRGLL